MMDIMANERLVDKAAEMSDYFADQMHSFEEFDVVTDVRSIGMMAGIELKADGAPGARGHVLQKKLFDSGLHQKNTGDVLIIAPPLVSEKAHIDEMVSKLREAVASA